MRVSLLHGFAGDPSVWDDVAAGLGDLDPVAVALPGHGDTPVRDTWQANLDSIDVDRSSIAIGYSLGARVALGLLAEQRVLGAILVGVNPGLPEELRGARRAADARWARLLRERGIAPFLDSWEAQPMFASQARVAPERLAARRTRRMRLDPEQLARSLEVMGLAEMPDYRSAVTADCTLIVGADDTRYVEIASSYQVAQRLIAGAGHDVLLEQPSALASAIRELTRR